MNVFESRALLMEPFSSEVAARLGAVRCHTRRSEACALSRPHGVRAHPTDEHFLPLFVALGAAHGDYKAERLYNQVEMGSLAMDAYRFS